MIGSRSRSNVKKTINVEQFFQRSKTENKSMRRSAQYVVGALALSATLVLVIIATPNVSNVLRNKAENRTKKTEFNLSPKSAYTDYLWTASSVASDISSLARKIDAAQQNGKEPKKEDKEKLRRYCRALLEIRLRSLACQDPRARRRRSNRRILLPRLRQDGGRRKSRKTRRRTQSGEKRGGFR